LVRIVYCLNRVFKKFRKLGFVSVGSKK